jgi:hypothetical protein
LINKSYHKLFRILIKTANIIRVFNLLSKILNQNNSIIGLTIKDDECPVCYEIIKSRNYAITQCNHKFCMPCLLKVFQEKNACPCCRNCLIEDTQYNADSGEDDSIENEIDDFINNQLYEEIDMNNLSDDEPRYNEGPQATNNQIMAEFELQGFTLLDAIMLITERYAIEENKNTNAYYYTVLYGFNQIVQNLDSQSRGMEPTSLPD